jgi:hypothetical protein
MTLLLVCCTERKFGYGTFPDKGLAFHAVQSAKTLLNDAGFQEIKVPKASPHSFIVAYSFIGKRFLGFDLQAGWQVLFDPQHHHPGRLCDWQKMDCM